MIVEDKNLTLQPPDGFRPESVEAQGAYLRLQYVRFERSMATAHYWTRVTIYLNDMGREVLRTTDDVVLPTLRVATPKYDEPEEPKAKSIWDWIKINYFPGAKS